jgi:hypothetical protein
MASVPPEVLHALAGMSGYDRMLEIDRIASAYGVGHAWIEQQIAGSAQPSSPAQDPNNFAPSSKEAPALPSTPRSQIRKVSDSNMTHQNKLQSDDKV